jgi:hypothetical protein
MKTRIRTPRKCGLETKSDGLQKIAPIPVRPPGYFADCYTAEEIQRENRLADALVTEKLVDLEGSIAGGIWKDQYNLAIGYWLTFYPGVVP